MTFCLTVSAQKKMTDREMEGLKGSVKTVFEEDMVTKSSGSNDQINKRVKWEEQYFDKDGNLTLKLFPPGNVKYIYSIIDGFKTFKSVPIKEEKNPTAKMMMRDIGKEKPLEENEKIVPPDDRFSFKYVYEYDANGKITKEKSYLNNGKLWKIKTKKYDGKGQKIEETVEDTVAITKYTHKYDDKGNLIETVEERDVRNGVDRIGKTVYSDYKVDVQGNWLERQRTETSEMRGEVYSMTMISYRKISYF